jgi:N6-adenosine-specific RNA methylase IME4
MATKALPEGKHRVLLVDAPWRYSDERAGLATTAAEDHYPTMSVAELCALDIGALAADDSVLLCWATFPLLPDALETVKAWGKEHGADYMLGGVISSIEDTEGGKSIVFYQVDMNLINLETNTKVWQGQKKIKKYIERSSHSY